jgi:hypothetical protein
MIEKLLRSITRENGASDYGNRTEYASTSGHGRRHRVGAIAGARGVLSDGPKRRRRAVFERVDGALQRSVRFVEDSGDQSFVIL